MYSAKLVVLIFSNLVSAVKIVVVRVCSSVFLVHWFINVWWWSAVVLLLNCTVKAIKYPNIKAKCYVYVDFAMGKERRIHSVSSDLFVLHNHTCSFPNDEAAFFTVYCECIIKQLNCTWLIFLEISSSKVDKTLAEPSTLVKEKHLEKTTRTEMASNSLDLKVNEAEAVKLKEEAEPGIGKHAGHSFAIILVLVKLDICSARKWIYSVYVFKACTITVLFPCRYPFVYIELYSISNAMY